MKYEFDANVVGGGGSGLACALAAAQRGAEVLLLESRPQVGGTTGIAIGSFTASRTRLQQRAGVADNPADHEADAAKFGPPEHQAKNNAALRQRFLEQAAETLHWLMDLGLTFHGPHPEPPNRVPRMHNVVPNAKAYVALFQSQFVRHGGALLCDARVERLDRSGERVCGVTARADGQLRSFRARHGVVLAAGDYANSPELIARQLGPEFAAVEGINPHAIGDGHVLAEQAGARLVNMEIAYGPELRFVPRPAKSFEQLLPSRGSAMRLMGRLLPLVPKAIVSRAIKRLLVTWQHPENSILSDGAILLNSQGRRFCNELLSPQRELLVAAQPGKIAYVLMDERLCQRYTDWPHFISTAPEIAYAYVADYLRLRPDVAVEGRSLQSVCQARGIPHFAARESVDEFNRSAADVRADEFGREGERQLLAGERWLLLGPVKAYFTTTEGGAAIDEQLQVLDASNRPIPGLYAVGQNGLGGMVLWGHGLHIAWALTSGRLVGQALAARATTA